MQDVEWGIKIEPSQSDRPSFTAKFLETSRNKYSPCYTNHLGVQIQKGQLPT